MPCRRVPGTPVPSFESRCWGRRLPPLCDGLSPRRCSAGGLSSEAALSMPRDVDMGAAHGPLFPRKHPESKQGLRSRPVPTRTRPPLRTQAALLPHDPLQRTFSPEAHRIYRIAPHAKPSVGGVVFAGARHDVIACFLSSGPTMTVTPTGAWLSELAPSPSSSSGSPCGSGASGA